jgi:hypothetical protein
MNFTEIEFYDSKPCKWNVIHVYMIEWWWINDNWVFKVMDVLMLLLMHYVQNVNLKRYGFLKVLVVEDDYDDD